MDCRICRLISLDGRSLISGRLIWLETSKFSIAVDVRAVSSPSLNLFVDLNTEVEGPNQDYLEGRRQIQAAEALDAACLGQFEDQDCFDRQPRLFGGVILTWSE